MNGVQLYQLRSRFCKGEAFVWRGITWGYEPWFVRPVANGGGSGLMCEHVNTKGLRRHGGHYCLDVTRVGIDRFRVSGRAPRPQPKTFWQRVLRVFLPKSVPVRQYIRFSEIKFV